MAGLRRLGSAARTLMVLGALSACAPPQGASGDTASAGGPPPVVPGDKSLIYFDADVFDLTLADELKLGTDKVHVAFASPTSLNSFPPRMNVWLAEVKKSDGLVTVVDPAHPTASRGLFGVGIIFDLIDAINTMQERRALSIRLARADIYDAKIVYDSGNGMAREVVFSRRPIALPDAAGPTAGPAVAAPPASGT